MKNHMLPQGKKLNKKQLNTIQGGRKICIPPGYTECAEFGKYCGEPECQVPLFLYKSKSIV
ncbi:bacteriocin [Chryseobacterium arthrosphaerae]|uniref:Bacteriocin n=1 Tax=Chryseobacterium arthrosphaerae TaxID=651561 RepID=A0A3S0NLB2_9FLAO|nr:bacteriocin [Chryseobacterium arthrosphaerae]